MEGNEMKVTFEDTTESGEDDSSGSEPELMVTTRAKRVTAGNRYNTVVAQEEAANDEQDDDVALLFAELDEEDEEYNSDEGADEADMSSSDDDDQGPAAGADDLEGEKEIQKEAKAERAKKRKADMALTSIASLKKKPKLDPTSLRRATAPKPSKRKERVTWLPEQGNTSARPSLRAQTIAHRAETHAKLKVNEAQRLKMKAIREKREREREAEAPKELTQADRLAEAERIERKNAKSLNRWETMEKKRAEEQAAKLAALKERKLDGAVVTWYSSSHKYNGLKDDKDTAGEVPTEAKKRGRKSKAFHEQMAAARLAEGVAPTTAPVHPITPVPTDGVQNSPVTKPVPAVAMVVEAPQVTSAVSQESGSFLTGIHKYASMEPEKAETISTVVAAPSSESTQPVKSMADPTPATGAAILQDQEPLKSPAPLDSQADTSGAILSTSTLNPNPNVQMTEVRAEPSAGSVLQPPKLKDDQLIDHDTPSVSGNVSKSILANCPAALSIITSEPPSDSAASPALTVPLIEVISTRNLVILDRVEDLTGQIRNDFNMFYNNRKTTKPAKHTPELCLITGLPARYKDPVTGIGYANAMAYKKLQQIKQHQFTWSSMLGCYVGRSTFVARGVPEGFLGT